MAEKWWFLSAFDDLKKQEVEVYGFKKLKNFKYNTNSVRVNTSIASGVDWFDATIEVTFGDIQVSLKDIKKAVLKKEQFSETE